MQRLEEKTEASIVPPPDGGSNSCVSLTIWGGWAGGGGARLQSVVWAFNLFVLLVQF